MTVKQSADPELSRDLRDTLFAFRTVVFHRTACLTKVFADRLFQKNGLRILRQNRDIFVI